MPIGAHSQTETERTGSRYSNNQPIELFYSPHPAFTNFETEKMHEDLFRRSKSGILYKLKMDQSNTKIVAYERVKEMWRIIYVTMDESTLRTV